MHQQSHWMNASHKQQWMTMHHNSISVMLTYSAFDLIPPHLCFLFASDEMNLLVWFIIVFVQRMTKMKTSFTSVTHLCALFSCLIEWHAVHH